MNQSDPEETAEQPYKPWVYIERKDFDSDEAYEKAMQAAQDAGKRVITVKRAENRDKPED